MRILHCRQTSRKVVGSGGPLTIASYRRHFVRKGFFFKTAALVLFYSAAMLVMDVDVVCAQSQMRGLGIVAKLGASRDSDDRQLARIQELGADTVVFTPGEWAANEHGKGQFSFNPETRYLLARIAAAHMRPVVLLFRKNPAYANPLDQDAFARYCSWVAATLNGSVAAYQIWNEPSNFDVREQYGGAWNGRDNAPWVSQFSHMMALAAKAIRQADPFATVIVSLEGPPLIYDLRDHHDDFADISGVALHPYPGNHAAEQVPWGGPATALRDGVSVADNQGSLASTIEIQSRSDPIKYLGRPLEAWITEYGFPTCDVSSSSQQYQCIAPEVQAAYHVRGLIVGLASGVKLWTPYELADEGENPKDVQQNFGLVRAESTGFAPKPAFFALRRVATILGKRWKYLSAAPARTTISESGSKVIEPNSSVEGPQVVWFRTDRGFWAFMWEAGVYDVQTRATAKVELPYSAELAGKVTVTDLVSGKSVPSVVSRNERDGKLIASLNVSSRPVVLQLPAHQ